jgi:uncharacterized protein YjbI with pentapeptide repeats
MAVAQSLRSEIQALLRQGPQGISAWNEWRGQNPGVRPELVNTDFTGADLTGVNLSEANLSGARFDGANLTGANLWRLYVSQASFESADLSRAHMAWSYLAYVNFDRAILKGTMLKEANLTGSTFRDADLEGSDLSATYLLWTKFTNANVSNVILEHASLIEAYVSGATFTGSFVYGLSAWKVQGTPKDQTNLVITPRGENNVVTDNFRIAQFLYLLLGNQEIRDIIDTVTSKIVLILGRFTPERKVVLNALRNELRQRNWVPVVFDFERPSNRNLTETISTLAHMARFVIADITDAKSIPQELQRIVPSLPSLPIQPIILASTYEYGMFSDFRDYPWVLALYRYDSNEELMASLHEQVIGPAANKAAEIVERRRQFLAVAN